MNPVTKTILITVAVSVVTTVIANVAVDYFKKK